LPCYDPSLIVTSWSYLEKLPLEPIPKEPELELAKDEPDLLFHKDPKEVMPQLMDNGNHRNVLDDHLQNLGGCHAPIIDPLD
jgi:hypothetical protein